MYSYTHTQPGPSSHVHRFIPTASQRKRSRPTQSRDKLHPPPTVHSRNVSDGRNHWGQQVPQLIASHARVAPTLIEGSACSVRVGGHPRFALCRGSPPSPPSLLEWALTECLARFAYRVSIAAGSLTCAGRWQKKVIDSFCPGSGSPYPRRSCEGRPDSLHRRRSFVSWTGSTRLTEASVDPRLQR